MTDARTIAERLIEEGIAARMHFQIWWALRHHAIPKYLQTINNLGYVDFFHASNAGHYKLFLLALAKIYDRDSRVAGLKRWREMLIEEGFHSLAERVETDLSKYSDRIKAIINIRSRSLVHNDRAVSRYEVYEENGITPNEIRELIDATCETIRKVALELGISNTIFESQRGEQATLKMLETLERGNNTQQGHATDARSSRG